MQINFSTYNILSALIPGFAILFLLYNFEYIKFDKEYMIPYTAVAFIIGYFVNTLSSWVEGLLYITWGGKPSDALLSGKNIWKVKFYGHEEARKKLNTESENDNPTNDELFQIAQRYSSDNAKVNALANNYAFSRVILTTIVICFAIMLYGHYANFLMILGVLLLIFIAWLRCKQMGYYLVREVLNCYLSKDNSIL